MFRNYIKTAFRSLLKNKISSAINIGGLSVGMAVAILIGLWVWDELSFDTYFVNYDRIAQVMQHQTENGIISSDISVSFPMGGELQNEYSNDFKHVVMASFPGDHVLAGNNDHFSERGMYMDAAAPEMFSLKMIDGGYGALKDRHSIILSASTAKAVFGNKDPINQLMRIDNKMDVKVTGVFEDLP